MLRLFLSRLRPNPKRQSSLCRLIEIESGRSGFGADRHASPSEGRGSFRPGRRRLGNAPALRPPRCHGGAPDGHRGQRLAQTSLVARRIGSVTADLEVWITMHENLRETRPMRTIFDYLAAALSDYVRAKGQHKR